MKLASEVESPIKSIFKAAKLVPEIGSQDIRNLAQSQEEKPVLAKPEQFQIYLQTVESPDRLQPETACFHEECSPSPKDRGGVLLTQAINQLSSEQSSPELKLYLIASEEESPEPRLMLGLLESEASPDPV